MSETRDMLLSLPFVAVKQDQTLDLWNVRPSGCDSFDQRTGYTYALGFVHVCKTLGNPTLLHHLYDAIRSGERTDDASLRRGFSLGVASMVAASRSNILPADALVSHQSFNVLEDLPFIQSVRGTLRLRSGSLDATGCYSEDVARGTFFAAALAKYLRTTGKVCAMVEICEAVSAMQSSPSDGVRVGANTLLCEYAMSPSYETVVRKLPELDLTPVFALAA